MIIKIVFLPFFAVSLALLIVGFFVVFMLFIPFIIYQELTDWEGHKRRKRILEEIEKHRRN